MQKVKGTYDVLPQDSSQWLFLEHHIHNVMKKHHISYVRTPVFEYYDVFHRRTEASDMVTKETYDFEDRSGRKITLRPEGTAGVIRSIVENKLIAPNHVLKTYYLGANYRYERPQKGRYREFYQTGIEMIGDKDAILDAELIQIAYELISKLGIKHVVVKLNHLGDHESRLAYKEALKNYLEPFKDQLSEDSQSRLSSNPLRILDSKIPSDQALLKDAPRIDQFISDEDQRYFQDIIKILDTHKIPYEIDTKLVRGLDYYAHVVFEIQTLIEGFGSQNALGGGGRYDNLVSELGGPDVSGIGFALGLERLLLACELQGILFEDSNHIDVAVLHLDKHVKKEAYDIYKFLQINDVNVDFDFSNKTFKTQLKNAIQSNLNYVIILGEEEVANNTVQIKNLKAETQETVNKDDLLNYLNKQLG
ncbi:MAG: histidine--tRNA ligase [Firmicutes bacterium]|nr:histidine--tRNA ligase [Bacillota bacterium]